MKIRLRSAVLILLVGALIIGISWQAIIIRIEQGLYVRVGEYADLESYLAHYYIQGDGDTTYLFITGSGTPCAYTDFYKLQNMLSEIGKTVTFDHPGSGWSTKAQTPRIIENVVGELSKLVEIVSPDKKVVLLCHSLGSLEAIGYAQEHPEKVKGIIFLDSGSPEFYSTDSQLLASVMGYSFTFMRVTGMNRLLGELGILLPLYGENIRNAAISEKIKDLDKAMYYRFIGNPATRQYVKLMNRNAKMVLEGSSIRNIPVLILSSDRGTVWDKVQMQLSKWFKNSTQIKIKNASHYLYWSNYDEVKYYINDFIVNELNK